jgi:hypothetical protein
VKQLLVATAFALVAPAASADYWDTHCALMGDVARSIMLARQNSMGEHSLEHELILEAVQGVGSSPEMIEAASAIVDEAYEEQQWPEGLRAQFAETWGLRIQVRCVRGEFRF